VEVIGSKRGRESRSGDEQRRSRREEKKREKREEGRRRRAGSDKKGRSGMGSMPPRPMPTPVDESMPPRPCRRL
jgi:hypothetical protein